MSRVPTDTGDLDRPPGDAAPSPWARRATQAAAAGNAKSPGADLTQPEDQKGAFVRLVLVLAAIAAVSVTAGVGKTVLILLAIIVMIVLHEFGHFLMAKLGGMKVTEFFVGFGTRVWSVRKGETEYGVKIAPLGGYVKILGMNSLEEVDPADESRTYRQQPFWRRISVAVAGSAMHFLLAFLMLFTIFFVIGDQGFLTATVPGTNLRVTQIDALATGPSPAEKAGFHLGDEVLSIDGQVFKSYDDLLSFIQDHPDQRLDFLVRRDGKLIHLDPTTVDRSKVKPVTSGEVQAPAVTNKPTGFVGIALDPAPVKYGFFESINKAGGEFVSLGATTFDALGSLFSAHGISSYAHMLVNQKAADQPGALRFESPVGITVLANQAANDGLEQSLLLLIAINVFVGIFNMVPLLPLDGGHVAIAVYERIRSRKGRRYYADAAKMMPFVYATLAVIAFIAVSALFLDVRDLVSIVRF